jgi:DNA-binding GntR family transcriptional regulator
MSKTNTARRRTGAATAAPRRTANRKKVRSARGKVVAASMDAYDRVRDLIICGRLAPGTPLIETDLSMRLGVSRTPIRAALQRLQQEGFIIGSRVGHMTRSIVSPLTADDMRELFMMVGALEGIAARFAAELEKETRLRLVSELRGLNAELATATSAVPHQITAAQDLHERFHRAIAEAAAGPRLRAELTSLRPQAERYGRAYTGATITEFEASLTEHEVIIAAIESGDSEVAEKTTVGNWRNGAQRYRQVVEVHGERGSW